MPDEAVRPNWLPVAGVDDDVETVVPGTDCRAGWKPESGVGIGARELGDLDPDGLDETADPAGMPESMTR